MSHSMQALHTPIVQPMQYIIKNINGNYIIKKDLSAHVNAGSKREQFQTMSSIIIEWK